MKFQSSTTMLAGLSLCAGAAIGLGTGVLFAPRSGGAYSPENKTFRRRRGRTS